MTTTTVFQVQNVYTKVIFNDIMIYFKVRDKLKGYKKGYQQTTGYKEKYTDGRTSLIDENNCFFTGMLPHVLNYFNLNGIEVILEDQRIDPLKDFNQINLVGKVLRAYQFEAVAAAIQYKRGFIGAATNAGKTVCAGALIQATGLKTLFLTHRSELYKQTIKELSEMLGHQVGSVQGEHMDFQHVTVAMVPSLTRNLEDPEVLKYLSSIDLVIVDEAHHASARTYENILIKINAFYRIGLSGTPYCLDDEYKNFMLQGLIGEILFEIKNSELIKMGVSAVPKIEIETVNSFISFTDQDDYELIYRLGIIENRERNTIIANRCKDWIERGLNTLIVINYESHGDYLREFLISSGIPEESVQFINGNTKNKKHRAQYFEAFKKGKLPILISSLIIQEGISIRSIGSLVFALGEYSNVRVLQVTGRGLRENEFNNTVEVVDFLDKAHPMLEKHSRSRIAMFKEDLGEYVNVIK